MEQTDRGDVGRLTHRPELDGRPTDELHNVQRRGQERATESEDRPEQDHAGNALSFAGETDERERQAPEGAPDDDREHGLRKPEPRDEERSRHQDEEPDREIPPQDREIDAREAPVRLGDGADPPRGRLPLQDPFETLGHRGHRRAPSAGMIRIRFQGSPAHPASLSARSPRAPLLRPLYGPPRSDRNGENR